MRVISMFAGIGGFDLGLERTGGFKTVAVAEVDKHACEVLKLRFPDAVNVGDVTTAEYPDAEVICAGFPCQDISFAGAGAGLAGERSGLFWEVVRAIRMVRPRYVILENVAALLSRGLDDVLGALAEVGYDTEWHCIPASAVDAPHRRDRIWIIAHPRSEQQEGGCHPISGKIAAQLSGTDSYPAGDGRDEGKSDGSRGNEGIASGQEYGLGIIREVMAHASRERCAEARELRHDESAQRTSGSGEDVAHAASIGLQGQGEPVDAISPEAAGEGQAVGLVNGGFRDFRPTESRMGGMADGIPTGLDGHWIVEPETPRVSKGTPKRADRLRALGNAVVPQIPELIGRAILAAHTKREDHESQ